MSQSLYFDTNNNEDDSLFTLINDINRIRFSYYDNDKFNTNIIELSDFLNNKAGF